MIKPGDKVLCIESIDDHRMIVFGLDPIEEGEEFIVNDIREFDGEIGLILDGKNCGGVGYNSRYFIKAEPNINMTLIAELEEELQKKEVDVLERVFSLTEEF